MSDASDALPRIPRIVLFRVFLRSLLLQASWNPKGMQNLGLAYALYPALEVLYPERTALQAAVQRHLAFFNTHPYSAAAILGGVLYHERRIAAGQEPPSQAVAFKAALMGPLAALGDGFFWLSLKPAAGALSAALVPWLGLWAVLLFLVLYNAVHFSLRGWLFRLGLEQGDGLVVSLSRVRLPQRGALLRNLAAACAGGLVVIAAQRVVQVTGQRGSALLALACVALAVLTYMRMAWRPARYVALYLAAGLAVLSAALIR